jgi:UDP-N-acetylglucosamine 2-epimerase
VKQKPLVVSIVGARPQFIKLAPLAKALAKSVQHEIIHTGQHYDDVMSGNFFRSLKLPKPKINLSIGSGSHGEMTGRMLADIEKILIKLKPQMVLVYGDTNSTLAGALAAAKLGVPIGHIEAGMRSFVRDMPEEINRKVADHLSSLHFCATKTAAQNLKNEGIKTGIVLCGDLMYELLHESRSIITQDVRALKKHKLNAKQFLLATVHRAATTDSPESLKKLAKIFAESPYPILFPMHPRTVARIRQFKLQRDFMPIPHLHTVAPFDYFTLMTLASHAKAVLTDSGGLQKEAVFLGTPVLTLRDETEWVETLKQGNVLVGLDTKKVKASLISLPKVKSVQWKITGRRPSEHIKTAILNFLK